MPEIPPPGGPHFRKEFGVAGSCRLSAFLRHRKAARRTRLSSGGDLAAAFWTINQRHKRSREALARSFLPVEDKNADCFFLRRLIDIRVNCSQTAVRTTRRTLA